MSEYAVTVERVVIETHPNADQIELARVGDYVSIVRKGDFKTGDLAVYIPEQSIVPEWMLDALGLRNKLAGAAKNRVKAIKLRGVLSQGLVYPVQLVQGGDGQGATFSTYYVAGQGAEEPSHSNDYLDVNEGDDVAEFLGLTKYEPIIPTNMAGRIVGADFACTINYNFDNLKRHPDIFEDGEPVVVTEKIHGTLLLLGVMPPRLANERYYKGRVVISSKGMAQKGFVLDPNDETNLYAQVARAHGLFDTLFYNFANIAEVSDAPVFLLGEAYGQGVQDLAYGGQPLQYRAFDFCEASTRDFPEWAPYDQFVKITELLCVPAVPVLYTGPFDRRIIADLTDGATVAGEGAHMREGVVVKSLTETRHPRFGRKIAKSVSEAYLLRKNATEFN